MKWNHVVILGLIVLPVLAGCGPAAPPDRVLKFQGPADLVRAFRDYRRLEAAGVTSVRLRRDEVSSLVNLSEYGFLIGRGWEKLGRPHDAVKVYLHLLMNQTLQEGDEQIATRAENRLRWVLGDKHWVVPSLDELVRRLSAALADRDVAKLQALISPDFGLGWSEADRWVMDYHEGMRYFTDSLRASRRIIVEGVVMDAPHGRVRLRTVGWTGEHPVWYFFLRRDAAPVGWEWDLVAWEKEDKTGPSK